MTKLKYSNRAARFGLALALVAATFSAVASIPTSAEAAPVDCSRGVNLSFEQPVIASDWTIVAVPGWSTTDTGIELWKSGFNGAIAPSGNQLSELQGNNNAANWQEIPTLPGDIIAWSFYHRGRQKADTVRVNIGSPATQVTQGEFTTGTAAFVQYGASYTVPAAQTTTRFVLQPLDTGSIGNLVDLVAFNLTCDIGIATTYTGTTDPDASGTVTVGDVSTFSYLITNLGTATLTSIGVVDTLGDTVSCAAATIAPTATTTCSLSHVVTQAEIDTGVVASDATVSGTDAAGVVVTANDTEAVPIAQEPSVTLVKSGIVDDTAVSPSGRPDPGDLINYTFAVTNTGNVTLSSISVDDPRVPSVVCPPDDLLPGNSVDCAGSYAITQGDIENGSVLNTATAYGTPPVGDPVNAADDATVSLAQITAIDVAKSSIATEYDTLGDPVGYDLVIKNTGNVTLVDVDVTDANADAGSISCTPSIPASLLPGATASCTAHHTVTQADLDGGTISNIATVTAVGEANGIEVSDTSNEVTVTAVQNAEVAATKTSTSSPIGDGSFEIAYTISVTNMGNVTATGVAVADDLDLVFGAGGYTVESLSSPHFMVNSSYDGSADTALLTGSDSLAPGKTGLVRLEITTSPMSGKGPFVNSAFVEADGSGQPVQAVAGVSTELDVAFDLTIAKSTSASVAPGNDTTWKIVVANEGPSATFGPITVTDTLTDQLTYVSATGTGWSCSQAHGTVTCQRDGTLNAGESSTVSIVTTVNAPIGASVQNNASVVAADAVNESNQTNNSAVASITVDSLPVTGIDTADFGAVAIASILFGLLLLVITGRKRSTRAR